MKDTSESKVSGIGQKRKECIAPTPNFDPFQFKDLRIIIVIHFSKLCTSVTGDLAVIYLADVSGRRSLGQDDKLKFPPV